jgi:hypothetical protein
VPRMNGMKRVEIICLSGFGLFFGSGGRKCETILNKATIFYFRLSTHHSPKNKK